jgi:hypothetical protein
MLANEINKKLHGEWFVFVNEHGQDIPFTISTVEPTDYLIIRMGNTDFTLAKIK